MPISITATKFTQTMTVLRLVVSPRRLYDNLRARIHHFDQRHRISDDWYIITYFVKAVFLYAYLVLTHKLNYWYRFESQAQKTPHNVALVYVGSPVASTSGSPRCPVEKYTYSQLYSIVLRLSYILANEYGIKENDTIGIDMRNRPLFVFTWLALWNLGAKPAFFNYNVSSDPLVHSIHVSGVSQILIDSDTRSIFTPEIQERVSKECSLHFIDEKSLESRIKDSNSLEFRQPDSLRNRKDHAWDAGCYIFTSGTTGLPKAAIMSWRKINLGTALYSRIVRITTNSTVFSAMPLYHSTASVLGLLPTFTQGGAFAIADKFSARSFWYQARDCQATHIQYVGEICRYLLNRPVDSVVEKTHSVRVAYGNGLRAEIWQEFKDRFGIDAIGEFFASTEAPIATTSFQTGNFGIGACRNYGTIINYILSFQQRLVKMDPDDPTKVYRDPITGLSMEPKNGEPGQLLFRITRPKKTYIDFQGYKNNENDTAKKIVRDVYKKGDCWMSTGDLLKKDKHGLLYFVDRLGDTFRWKSENVSTNEVEIQIVKSGLVENAVVVGIKLEGYEGRAGYMIIKAKGQVEHKQLLRELAKQIKNKLPKYAIPVFARIVKEYKMTDTHKIIKSYYSNEKFFENREGEVFYLKTPEFEYELLTKEVWEGIQDGAVKL